jgi:hypothetical protein
VVPFIRLPTILNMLSRLPLAIPRVLIALATAFAGVACDASASPDANAKSDKPGAAFELTPRQNLTFAGRVIGPDAPKEPGVVFGVIPTSPIQLKPYYNVFTGLTENRPVPGVLHPVPVLRAEHVQLFAERPDPAKLALDQVAAFEREAEIDGKKKYAVVSDGKPENVRLITFSEITIPQDKTNEWRLKGTMESLKLPEHIDDPIADRGRAVLTKEPLPLKARLLYGTRKQSFGPAELFTLDLPDGKPKKIGEATEPRVSAGTSAVADRVDMRELRITDKAGKVIGGLKLENDEFQEFTISPDGKSFAYHTERYVEVPDALPRRELVTIVCGIDGTKRAEFIGYDEPAFMPGGNVLLTAESAGDGLFIGDVKSGKVTPIKIQDAPDEGSAGPDWPRQPAISPDGKWVAYVSGRRAYVVGVDGKGWSPLWLEEVDPQPQTHPTFSPDGKFVAAVITPLNVMTGPGQVVVFDLKRRVRQPLAATQGADSEGPLVWQP